MKFRLDSIENPLQWERDVFNAPISNHLESDSMEAELSH